MYSALPQAPQSQFRKSEESLSQPFVSIVLPTRNRPLLVCETVKSVLRQTYCDYELLVVDNSDDCLTREAVSTLSDGRLRYFHTGGLSMHDNWDYAFSQAMGRYVMGLTDRLFFKTSGSLRLLVEAIKRTGAEVVCWPWANFDLKHQRISEYSRATGREVVYSSERVLRFSLRCDIEAMLYRTPRGLNSCQSRGVLDEVRQLTGGRVCLPLSPDFTLGYAILALRKRILYMDTTLVVQGGFAVSTGASTAAGGVRSSYVRSLGGDLSRWHRHMPVQVFTARNTILNDMVELLSLVSLDAWAHRHLNKARYYWMIRQELQILHSNGAGDDTQMRTWRAALARESWSTKAAIWTRTCVTGAKETGAYAVVARVAKRIVRRCRRPRVRAYSPPAFGSIEESLVWHEKHGHYATKPRGTSES